MNLSSAMQFVWKERGATLPMGARDDLQHGQESPSDTFGSKYLWLGWFLLCMSTLAMPAPAAKYTRNQLEGNMGTFQLPRDCFN